MIKLYRVSRCLLLLILILFIGCRKEKTEEKLNISDFKNPPFESSVHAWWHWLDNSITREGITKDLEAMKKQGICTATILNVGLLGEPDMGVPQVKFNTAEWFGMFEWALQEADRLGMKLGAHNCDGWSSSGGPWISPEYSMKRCVWSRTIIDGGVKTDISLPEPKKNLNYYKDIRIIAFPLKTEENSFQKARPQLVTDGTDTGDLLYDSNPFSMIEIKEGTRLDITFQNDFNAAAIAIHPRVEFVWENLQDIHYQVTLKASSDGRNYRMIRQFDGPPPNKTSVIAVEPSTAKKFRLEFSKISGIRGMNIGISEVEILGNGEKPVYNPRIPFHLEKTVTTIMVHVNDILAEGSSMEDAVPEGEIRDVTQYMTPGGKLKWDAPGGKWEVLRIGYTTTGAVNGPATIAGTGLECDKMDTAALNLHFRSFPAKLIAHAGKYAGKTFEYIFIDSWECRYQNWTQNFAAEFEKRRHYSITNWLPVICGITVADNSASERFLHDFRQTIAELIEENYYRQYAVLCKHYGVRSHAEVIYGGTSYPPLDILKSNSYMDVPMFEFWAGFDRDTKLINYTPGGAAAFEIPAQAGALYGKKIIPAEAYTGYANYSETPWDLKTFGDRAFCSGINQMVLHSYVHQPFEKKPGVTLGQFGQSFNRHNPWWDFSSQWFTYHARVQYILQQGVPAADILYFTGDRFYQEDASLSIPNISDDTGAAPDRDAYKDLYKIPDGYFVQRCNLDILMNHCRVKKGKLLLDNGLTYEMLLLPDDRKMESATLKRIADLVNDGAVIAGPKPLEVAGNGNFEENENLLKELSDKIWGKAGTAGVFENTYGKGKVYSGLSVTSILDKLKVKPDFSSPAHGSPNLMNIHKKAGASDVYFVVNQENVPVERECIFRITGSMPEILDPEYGTFSSPAEYREEEGTTHVKVRFGPKESLFFVFNAGTTLDLKKRQEPANNYKLVDFTGSLVFEDMPGKAPLEVHDFKSWTNDKDPDIKYYSGKAKYTLDFDVPADVVRASPVYVAVESAGSAVEIMLNGKSLGYSSFPGFRFEVTGVLKEKDNRLEIRVANVWRNRIIGDFTEFGKLRNCWTTSPVDILPGKGLPLKESGLLEPVSFVY